MKKETPQEIRKVKSEKQTIIYNTSKDWLRIQNFNKNNVEVTYYLQVNEKQTDLSMGRFIIPNVND